MTGIGGFGSHALLHTLVHYEDPEQPYDYCLGCRRHFACSGQVTGLLCAQPAARVSEADSRHPALRIRCEHPPALWCHYQQPGFTPTGDWDDNLLQYHYCRGCQAATSPCPALRPPGDRHHCTTPTTARPLDDSRRIAAAWRAAGVRGRPTSVRRA